MIVSPSENRLSSGTRAICSGTIWSANTKMKSMFRPLKSIHANAYAASDAITIGNTVAGIVIASELMKAVARVVEVPPEFHACT
ncbi:Uncharacterised protein [Mycobacterium tuberculosis]|nr:Uncharacterised protein [Mycobacterium tuberculosis]